MSADSEEIDLEWSKQLKRYIESIPTELSQIKNQEGVPVFHLEDIDIKNLIRDSLFGLELNGRQLCL